MRILAISDLHVSEEDQEALEQFLARAQDEGPDVLVLAGDLTAGKSLLYEQLLSRFDFFEGLKFFVPGNHDLWQAPARRHTWRRYGIELPASVAAAGWHYLDLGPVLQDGVGFVGCMGWYDYSLRQMESPNPNVRVGPAKIARPGGRLQVDRARSELRWEELTLDDYRTGALQVHEPDVMQGLIRNDIFYVDWERSEEEMVEHFCAKLHQQAQQVARSAKKLVIINHFVGFGEPFPHFESAAPAYARAFSGSVRLGEAITELPHVKAVICGHWHHPGSWRVGNLALHNVSARRGTGAGTLITV